MSERRVAFIGAALVALGPVSMALYTPAMPQIGADFAAAEAAVKLTLTAYFAGFALAQLIAGPLSDAYGRKATTTVFLALYTLASVGAMLAGSVEELTAWRALQGVGASVGIAVARAVVRDLFAGEASSRIMNAIGMMLALGPAIAPTIGGLTLQVAPWPAIFALLALCGIALLALIRFGLVETVTRDPARFRPRALVAAYGELLRAPRFVCASVVLLGSVGIFYAQATMLPFVLIGDVGLSPAGFGLAMILQTGSYFCGALATRWLMARFGAETLVRPGLALMGAAAALMTGHAFGAAPTLLSVMGPVALAAFGVALVMPFVSTAALAPFPHIAGAAAALSGFAQMGGGLLGGLAAAAVGAPLLALGTVIPAMILSAVLAFEIFRRLPGKIPAPA